MNLNMIRSWSETEDLVLSITKNCGKLIEQIIKLIQILKKHWNLKLPKQEKLFPFNHLFVSVMILTGWLD